MATSRAICLSALLFLSLASWWATARAASDTVLDLDNDHDHGHHLHSVQNGTKLDNSTDNGNGNGKRGPAYWEPYVYGTVAVTVVSLLSLAGIVVIPFIKRKETYDAVMLTFMALAVGTMTSDALLHLVPETLGLEDHAESEHEDGHEDEAPSNYLGKMIALTGTLYGLYLLELIMHSVSKLIKKKRSTRPTEPEVPTITPSPSEEKPSAIAGKWASNVGHHGGHPHSHGHSHGLPDVVDESSTILGLKTYCFVIVLSDAMHNFTDGLAIGAAFSKSSAAGLGITLAVVCHEIPHEIGNFAILLNSGMGLKKALLLNFLSAVTCFAGLYPGIVAGQQDALSQWIFAAVAAGFLYVALVHMLRELQSFESLSWWMSLILQNLGMLVGFIVIFLLAIYEEQLNGMT